MITEDQYKEAVAQKELAKKTIEAYHRQKAEEFEGRWERWKQGEAFTDVDLIYSARARCNCGAGLAYPKDCNIRHQWTCGDVLTHRVSTNKGHDVFPFMAYDIKSEQQPSAQGATTRPDSKDNPAE